MTEPYFVPDEEILSPDGKWLRTGGCTVGCGACCRFIVLPLDPRICHASVDRVADWIKWLKLHGVEVTMSGDWLAAKIPLACHELQPDGTCGVYGTDKRPNMCNAYPKQPLDLEGVEDVCTYRWEEAVSD